MSKVTFPIKQDPTRNEGGPMARFRALCRDRGIAGLSVAAGLCAVPISIAVSEIFLALALTVRLAGFARHPAAFRPPRVFWYWLVWAGLETASWLHSPDLRAGNDELRHLLLIAALFFTVPAVNRSGDKVRVWKGIFATATLGSLSLIIGYFVRMARYQQELAAGGDPSFYLRTGGLLHHWAIYGLVEILVFAALLEFRAAYPGERRWMNPALAVNVLAIVLSLSRGLWLATFLVFGFHLVWRRSLWVWLLPLVPIVVFLLSPGPVRHRFTDVFQPDYSSNAERVQMWRVGWRMIRERPVFGVGPGRIDQLYGGYLSPGEPVPIYHGHLHNNALQLGAQFGIFVLCAALIFVTVLVRDLVRACKWSVDRDQKFLCRSGLQGVTGYLLLGLMDYTYGHSLGLILLAFSAISPLMETYQSRDCRRTEPALEQVIDPPVPGIKGSVEWVNPMPFIRQLGILAFLSKRCLWLILILALALRTYHLAYPPWDYQNWRQTITLMVARDFARHNFHLFHPHVLWLNSAHSAEPGYFKDELSIESLLAALLYKIFGESDVLARIVVITFSMMGVYFLYHLLNRRMRPLAAYLGAFVYSLLPYHLFFGRVFMPDVPALSLALGALDVLDRWTDNRKWRLLVTAAALTALAILQKATVIFVALPMVFLFGLACGRRLLRQPEPYVFGVIATLPPVAWYSYNIVAAPAGGFSISPAIHLFVGDLKLWTEFSFVRQILKALAVEAFSPLGLVLAIAGLFWPLSGRAAWMFRLWIVGAALLLFLIPNNLPENHHHLALLLPGGAALTGLALADLARRRPSLPAVAAILVLFAAGAIYSALPFYQHDRWPRDLGCLLNRLTNPEDLIVTESGGSPNMLYFADRRGWLLNREYDPAILTRLSQLGARYYADAFIVDSDKQRNFFQVLDSHFGRLTSEDASWPWPIYDVTAPFLSLRDMPAVGEIQRANTINFGGQIELQGMSLREVLDWPSSFEVIYYWQCLKHLGEVQIFMSITDSTGHVAYRQEHWPRVEPFPTKEWKVGDSIRGRYVMVLSESLPAGKYQIRVGWFDPARGGRLPIFNRDASRPEDSARVAEIEVHHPPRYGWFRAD
jgi:O-antigen ligase/4-amino-4-deoxy-L-arabinose transferase-like glycosyltransferase